MSYYIEIDISDRCIDRSDERGWAGASMLIAEGTGLMELLEDAKLYWSDQDGGEAGESEADEDWATYLIIEEFEKQQKEKIETIKGLVRELCDKEGIFDHDLKRLILLDLKGLNSKEEID